LGLTGFYQRFIKGYAALVAPLTSMLCKDKFQWSEKDQTTFEQLKRKITEASVLVAPDFFASFTIEIDASSRAIDTVLQHNSHLIAYYSKMLCLRLHLASAYV